MTDRLAIAVGAAIPKKITHQERNSMKLKRNLIATALACGLVAGSAVAQTSGLYSNVVSFGDSYSDIGAFSSGLWFSNAATAQGTFPALVASHYGVTQTSAYTNLAGLTQAPNATGNNFAVGGAQVQNTATTKGSVTQVSDFITRSGGKVDPNALYTIFIGGNNVSPNLNIYAGGGAAGQALALNNMVVAAQGVVTQVAQLRAAGAKNIVVLNLSSLAAVPQVTQTAAATQAAVGGVAGSVAAGLILQGAAELPAAYSQTLAAGIPKGSAMILDFANYTSLLTANPAAFGFTNTTIPVCDPSIAPPDTNWTACHGTAGNGALYADPLHISAAAHAQIAQWMTGMIDAVATGNGIATMAAQVPLGRSGAEWRTIDSRTRNYQNYAYKGDRFFVAGDYSDANADAPTGPKFADGNTYTYTLGYETTFGDNMLVGGTLGREKVDLYLVNRGGKLTVNETTMSLYFTRRLDANWYVNGIASHGNLSYDSHRNASLGITTTTEYAQFGGYHNGVKGQIGYQMRTSDFIHGPFVGTDWEKVHMDNWSEGGRIPNSTSIAVSSQNVEQAHYRVGYELAAGATSTFRPYAQISYDNQYLKDKRSFTAGLASTGSGIQIDTQNDTGGFGRAAVGASMTVAKDSEVSLGVMTTFSNSSGNDTAVNLVWSWAL
ncbi:MAG: autotransporter domain-containing protein [Rhodocyclaceae bacterium]|nr:autotransporter domain-containing protein [Rhodocyclaceae bacterium]